MRARGGDVNFSVGGHEGETGAGSIPGGRTGKRLRIVCLVVAGLASTRSSRAESPPPARLGYEVAPFQSEATTTRNLAALAAGASLLLAERLDAHPRLRCVGPAAMIGHAGENERARRAAAAGAAFVIHGRLGHARQDLWHLELSVSRTSDGAQVGEASGELRRDELPRTVVRLALAALRDAGVASDASTEAALTAPFARDPYAFVLYARGVAAYLGDDGRAASGERALPLLTRSLVIDPKVPETRRLAGLIQLDAGRPGHARATWAYAVDLRPRYKAAWAHLAALDRTQGAPSAIESYRKVLTLDGDDLVARRSLGELLADAGRLEEAEAELQRVVASWPGDLRSRRALAVVLAGRHAGQALIQELETIVALDPADQEAITELAGAYVSLGRFDEAAASYESLLKKAPKNLVVMKLLADVWREKGETAKALALYERVHRLQPDDPRPLFALGELYFKSAELNQAERMFNEAAQVPGMLGDAYADLGAVALRRGQLKEALFFLSRATERRPLRATVHYNYGLALHRANRDDEAANELATSVRLHDKDAEAWFASGVVALRRHRLGEAAGYFRRATEVDPGHRGAQHNLGLLKAVLGSGSETSSELPPPDTGRWSSDGGRGATVGVP